MWRGAQFKGILRNEWDLPISITDSAKPGNGSISYTHTAGEHMSCCEQDGSTQAPSMQTAAV